MILGVYFEVYTFEISYLAKLLIFDCLLSSENLTSVRNFIIVERRTCFVARYIKTIRAEVIFHQKVKFVVCLGLSMVRVI